MASCIWRVKGRLRVKNDLFTNSPGSASSATMENLHDVKVSVWASTLIEGGWVHWKNTRTDKEGRYEIVKRPREADPIGCKKRRRIKIVVAFDGRKAKVVTPSLSAYKFTIISGKMEKGKTVELNYTFDDTVDGRWNVAINGQYKATRAAQMYWAYCKLYDQLKDWNAKQIKFKVVWPDGKGTADYMGWSPPGGYVRIARSWFWRKKDGEWKNIFKVSGFSRSREFAARELIHEAVHQWFNNNVYVPDFTGGTPNTHDFLENPALTFYEEFAEFAAIELNRAMFGITGYVDPTKGEDNNNELVLSRRGVYLEFKNAKKKNGRNYYFGDRELRPMIEANSREYPLSRWHQDLYRANKSVENYLKLLIYPDWFKKSYGNSYKSGSKLPQPVTIDTRIFRCGNVSNPMFTPKQIIHAVVRWKNKWSNKRIPSRERGIKGFYDYLAGKSRTYNNDFIKQRQLFLKLGDPHYAGEKDGIDACAKATFRLR